jgi:hypothetical protein
MAITYTWSIQALLVENTPEPDTAVMSNFTINGVDEEGHTGSVSYSVNLLPADVSNFTPYNEITEQQAIDWTKGALDATGPNEEGLYRTEAMEGEVAEQIANSYIVTPQAAPLPWAS